MKHLIKSTILVSVFYMPVYATDFVDVCSRGDFGKLIVAKLEATSCKEVPRDEFERMSSTSIYFGTTPEVKKINKGDLDGLVGLTWFEFEDMPLEEIEDGAFDNLPSLNSISITGGKLKKIPKIQSNTIESIYLNNNEIDVLGPDDLAGLPNLIRFEANQNNINSIPNSYFLKNKKIKSIHISNNRIESVNATLFQGLDKLEVIYLDNNKISKLGPDTFSNIPNLCCINIHDNEITRIEANTFDNLPKLDWIEIFNNKLNYIDEDWFSQKSNFRSLGARNNKLSSISPNIFKNIEYVEFLDLRNNPISDDANIELILSRLLYLENYGFTGTVGINFGTIDESY